jgi:YD repeat-containing protein
MSDTAGWKVRGPVRTLRTETAEWDLHHEEWRPSRYSVVAAFRPDGKQEEITHHNPDGSVSHTVYLYDPDGRLVESQFRMNDEPGGKSLYSYDDAGRLVRSIGVTADGTQRSSELYSYDSDGRKTKRAFLPPSQPNHSCSYAVEGTEISYSAPGATTMTVRYGESGLPDEVLFHDAGDSLIATVTFQRHARGMLLSEQLQFAQLSPFENQLDHADAMLANIFGPSLIFSRTSYTYDSNDRVLERNTQMGSLSEERTRFLYDDYGNTVEQITEQAAREMEIDEQGQPHATSERSTRQDVRMEYRYDAHGNWIERIVSSRVDPNPDFQRSNVERREITYHAF